MFQFFFWVARLCVRYVVRNVEYMRRQKASNSHIKRLSWRMPLSLCSLLQKPREEGYCPWQKNARILKPMGCLHSCTTAGWYIFSNTDTVKRNTTNIIWSNSFNGSIRKNWSWTLPVGSCEKVIHKKSVGRAVNSKFLNFPPSPLIFNVYFLARSYGERPRPIFPHTPIGVMMKKMTI